MSTSSYGQKELTTRRRLAQLASVVSVTLLVSCNADAVSSQAPAIPRVISIEPVDSRHGSYRIVLEVDPGIRRLASKAIGAPAFYLGDQHIFHEYNMLGNRLHGFLREAPKPGDGVWFTRFLGSPASSEEARAKFVASGEPYLPIDFPALLNSGEQQRKHITDVRIETRTDAGPPETTIYIVKLVVENCTAENFVEPGPFGTTSRPKVYVEEKPADSTTFSDEAELIVAEFSVRPEENGEITLRYRDWKLTASEPFILPGQE